jgi:hypothetical protein
MMIEKYLVTRELNESIFLKVLRFFKIVKQKESFTLIIYNYPFEKGDIVQHDNEQLLIIKKIKQVK